MSKPICYLHMGTDKTGSTAIQYTLTKAHDHLLNCGLNYPDISNNFKKVLNGKSLSGNAGKIRRNLLNKGSEHVIRSLKPFSDRSENLVLSCEGFPKLPLKCLNDLAQGLSLLGYDIRCLIFFRPQTEYLVSRYLQKVKSNKAGGESLDDYINKMLRQDNFSERWNWYALAQNLETTFGENNVTAKWYPSLIRNDSLGAINTTLNWMGAKALPSAFLATHEKTINPTPGREALIILERLNLMGWGNRNFSAKFLNKAYNQGLLGSKVMLNPLLEEKINSATHNSNVKLLEHYCPELSAENELKPSSNYQQIDSVDENTVDRLKKIALHIFREGINNI